MKYWDKAWSLVEGCSPVSEGCDNCWLAQMDYRFNKGFANKYTDLKIEFAGHIKIREDRLEIPLQVKKPTVFAVWSDLFHEDVPMDFQADAFSVMGRCEHHTFLIFTKRPKLMSKFMEAWKGINLKLIFPHIWFGISVEDQITADERIPHLLQIPGKKFLNIEPMLEKINLTFYLASAIGENYPYKPAFDQVVLGGETGHNARPMHPDWVRSVRGQCQAAGVPFFFKGWGKWIPNTNEISPERYKSHGNAEYRRLLDGKTHDDLAWRGIGLYKVSPMGY
ncbi:MAG: DUF5131 family protein [Nitrospinae bacterium]|nr:DUF5131 family protein [Nitrospinota bacterium]